jgi:trehalose 6-phosphate phosphatase
MSTGTAGASLADHAARLSARADQVALCLDFDGTLSPIVVDPEAARPLAGVVELLGPLADRFAAVALISGRPADFLAAHAAAPGVRYLDLYGLQEIHDGQVRVDPRLKAGRPAVVADPGRWAGPIDQTAREVAARPGLEVVPGKMVWELRPAVPRDKGDAVRKVIAESRARSVVVAGDDLGDLAAFAATAQLAEEGGDVLRVAVRSAEAPPELLAAADLVVDGPPGLRELLELLAAPPGLS